MVRDAVTKEEIGLRLPGDDELWKPIRINQLMDSIYEQCGEEFRKLIELLLKASENAKTEEVERELIEAVSGRKRVSKRYVMEEAISAVALTDGTPLLPPAKALIELRYRGRWWKAPLCQGEGRGDQLCVEGDQRGVASEGH